MRALAILISLGLLVMAMGQKGLRAQSLDDTKEIKKQFQQYLRQQQRPITGNVVKKVTKEGKKDSERLWAATSWYRSRDRIKDTAPWNKRYGWQPTDNLPPLEPATTTTTTGAGGGGVGGGKPR